MQLVLAVLGGQAAEVLPVAAQSPGVGAVSLCLVPVPVLQKRVCAVLQLRPQQQLPRAAGQNTQRNAPGLRAPEENIPPAPMRSLRLGKVNFQGLSKETYSPCPTRGDPLLLCKCNFQTASSCWVPVFSSIII